MTVDAMLGEAAVILVVGSGGVGKTTTSAALAIRAAQLGRRVVVVTVDPAKRLADALGLVGLTAEPQRISGDVAGELWALMLDPRTTFDRLIARESAHDELTERIRNNRVYRNLADGLSGTQEYLATEELYALHQDSRFDLVVVDTPPSRHVLDIVDAPDRLVTLFDNRLYQLLTGKSSGVAGLIAKSAQRFVKTVAGVVGADVVEEAVEFFTVFESLEGGFRDRAVAVTALLRSNAAKVVLVAGPKPDVIATAINLTDGLTERQLAPDAAVLNLLHPDSGGSSSGRGEAAVRLRARANAEANAVAPLVERLGDVAIVKVPLLAEDIHDAEGLEHVVGCLALQRQ
jgi:anion-transporting  ArsA/GET3 family ATPase